MVWRPPRACPRRAANKVRCTDTGLQLHQRERKEPPLDALEDGEEEHGGGRVLQR